MLYLGETKTLSKLQVWIFVAVCFIAQISFAQDYQFNQDTPYAWPLFGNGVQQPIQKKDYVPIPLSESGTHYVIPEICLDRAVEIGIFTTKDPAFTKKALRDDYQEQRSIDFEAIDAAYVKTLEKVNDQIEDEESELIKDYLIPCKKDESKCHSHFKPNNKFHVRLYCDQHIYQSMIHLTSNQNEKEIKKIVKRVTVKKAKLDLDDMQDAETKMVTYQDNINKAYNVWYEKLVSRNKAAVKKSLMPDAVSFIMLKVAEEFSNYNYEQEIGQFSGLWINNLADAAMYARGNTSKAAVFTSTLSSIYNQMENWAGREPVMVELVQRTIDILEKRKQQEAELKKNPKADQKPIEEIPGLVIQYTNLKKILQDAIKNNQSPYTFHKDIITFKNDFDEWAETQDKQKALERQYALIALIKQFQNCCKSKKLLADYEVAASYAVNAGNIMQQRLNPVPYMVYKPTDYRTNFMLDQAEGEHWRKRLKTMSPLALTSTEKLEFYKYYADHPFFFRDTLNNYQQVQKLVMQQRLDSNFVGKTANDSMWSKRIQDFRAYTEFKPDSTTNLYGPKPAGYKGQWGFGGPVPYDLKEFNTYQDTAKYHKLKSVYPDDNPYGDPRNGQAYGPMDFGFGSTTNSNFNKNFLFNPAFGYDYRNYLEDQSERELNNQYSSAESAYYTRLFDGFVPYAFGRAAKSKILRELEKYKQSVAEVAFLKGDVATAGKVKFRNWAENLICVGDEPNKDMTVGERSYNSIKKYRLSSTYCAPKYANDRKKTFDRLYNAIERGEVVVRYQAETAVFTRRNRVYDAAYLANLNSKIKALNDYCWNNHSFSKYFDKFYKDREKTEKAVQTNKEYSKLVAEFFSTAGEEASGQSNFADILHFSPSDMNKNCFVEGKIFGDLELGYKFTPFNFGMSPTGYGWKPVSVDTVNKSIFQLDANDMIIMENEIDRKLNKEFMDLDIASRKIKIKNKKEFLEESASFRTLSMIEYAQDNPSENIGRYICRLIMSANDTEESRRAKIELYRTLAMIVGIGAAIVLLPVALAGTVSLLQFATVVVITGFDIYQSQQLVGILKRKRDLVDQSMTTGSYLAQDAMFMHERTKAEITNIRIQQGLAVVTSALFSVGPIKQTGKFLKLIAKDGEGVNTALRIVNLEHYVRTAGIDSKYLIGNTFKKFFTREVSKEEAAEFMRLLNNSRTTGQQVTDFVTQRWGSKLGDVPALIRNEVPSWFGRNIYPVIEPLAKPVVQAAKWTQNTILTPLSLRIKNGWYKFWLRNLNNNTRTYTGLNIRTAMYDELALQTNIARTLNKAIEFTRDTGKKVFSDEELEAMRSKIPLFTREVDGTFVRVLDSQFQEKKLAWMMRQPLYETNPMMFEDYMKATTNKELMMPEDWIEIFDNMTYQITSERDLKMMIKIAKFSQREYTGLFSKLRGIFDGSMVSNKQLATNNWRELLNLKELSGSVVYRERGRIIRKNIDRFMQIEATLRHNGNVQVRGILKEYAIANKLGRKDLAQAIDEKLYDYGQKVKGQGEKILDRIESAENPPEILLTEADIPVAPKRSLGSKLNPAFKETDEELFNKYQRQFWDEEKLSNEYFQKTLKNAIKRMKGNPDKMDVFAEAYTRALVKSQTRKTLINECSHPTSIIRGDVNNLYKKLLVYVSMGASAGSYEWQHHDDPHDMEYLSRISFDVLLSYLINKKMMKPVYSSYNQSPLVRDFIFYPTLVVGSVGVDGFLYQQTIQRAYNSEDRYRQEFTNMMLESPEITQKIEKYFAKYPELEKNMLARVEKLNEVFETIRNQKPGNYTDKDARDLFVASGLVESYFSDQAMTGLDYQHSGSSMYQTYVKDGLLELQDKNTELGEQIIRVMTDLLYQNIRNHGSHNPEQYDSELPVWDQALPQFARFDNETLDRINFNLDPIDDSGDFVVPYEWLHFPLALGKNSLVFQALCYGRYLPPPMNVLMGMGAYAAYKIPLDMWKFSERDERTGH